MSKRKGGARAQLQRLSNYHITHSDLPMDHAASVVLLSHSIVVISDVRAISIYSVSGAPTNLL
eukprot:5344-Heterococcus_DN1.PRE.1